MGLWKLIGELTMMNAKTPGDLATGAKLVEIENKKEEYRKQKKLEQKEIVIEWTNCINCHHTIENAEKMNYCPFCGIKFKEMKSDIITKKSVEFSFFDSNGKKIENDKLTIYKPGFYKIGSKNISSGDYMFFSPNGKGYFCCGRGKISKKDLLPLEDEEHNDENNINNLFETLKNDDCIYFENGFLINLNDFVKFKYEDRPGRSEFRVGIDIEPGIYILSPINSDYLAYFSIADEFSGCGKDSPENYRLDDSIELELFPNTILEISNNCIFEKIEGE